MRVPGSEKAREQKCQGAKVPGTDSFRRANWPGSEKALYPLFIYLILKSYTKYKIDRDRTIARNTDKNREEKDKKKPAQKTQGTCATLFMRHIC